MTHPSIRTCVGCGARVERGTLLRLRLGPDGEVRIDPDGSLPGRGASVHRRAACLAAAVLPRAVGRAFRGRARRADEGRLLEAARAIGPLEPDEPFTPPPRRRG